MSKQPIRAIVIQKFNTVPTQVFDAFINSKMIGQWMFGPKLRDEKIVHLDIDAKVGGAFSFLVLRNGEEIDHVGYYLEISRPNRLAFTWGIKGAESSHVTIDIDTLDEGCELTLTHEIPSEWASYVEQTKQGWTKMLGVLNVILKQTAA